MMADISRRNALILGGAGIGGVAIGGTGFVVNQQSGRLQASERSLGDAFVQPTEMRSSNGVSEFVKANEASGSLGG